MQSANKWKDTPELSGTFTKENNFVNFKRKTSVKSSNTSTTLSPNVSNRTNDLLSSPYFWAATAAVLTGAGVYYFSKQPAGQRALNKASATAATAYNATTGYMAQLINNSRFYMGYLKLSPSKALHYAQTKRDNLTETIHAIKKTIQANNELQTNLSKTQTAYETALTNVKTHIASFILLVKSNSRITDKHVNLFQEEIDKELTNLTDALKTIASTNQVSQLETKEIGVQASPELNNRETQASNSTPAFVQSFQLPLDETTNFPANFREEHKKPSSTPEQTSPTNSQTSSFDDTVIVKHPDQRSNLTDNHSPETQDIHVQQNLGFGLQSKFSSISQGIANFFSSKKSNPAAQDQESKINSSEIMSSQPTAN